MNAFEFGSLKLIFNGYAGPVLDQQKYSETSVSSSGGGGYLHNGSGNIAAPTVSSVTQTKHEFWVQLADGTQHPIQLSGLNIPLAVGQRVTLVYAQEPKGNSSLALLVNHAAKRYWPVNDSPALLKLAGDKTNLYGAGVAVAAIVVWFVIGFKTALFLLVGGVSALLWKWYQAKTALDQCLTKVGEFALTKE